MEEDEDDATAEALLRTSFMRAVSVQSTKSGEREVSLVARASLRKRNKKAAKEDKVLGLYFMSMGK